MDKSAIIQSLKQQLRNQYERALSAVDAASEAASGEDTKAESKYDTRGLEASYLATGQVAQADRLAKELSAVESFVFPELNNRSAIAAGALVTGKLDGNIVHYLLAPGGGGLIIETESGEDVTVLGVEAPLLSHLLDEKVGAQIERPPLEVCEIR